MHHTPSTAGHPHSLAARADGRAASTRRLGAVLLLVLLYMCVEIVGGVLTNSLALLADAGHMLSDAGALGLALFAIWFAARPAPPHQTYGYYRAEILAALVNGATLVAIAIFIFAEAFQRFRHPPFVSGGPMIAVALGGLAINLASLRILNAGKSESLNVRGVWLHVLTDMLGSVQAVVAGTLIWAFGWNWVDPVASVLIGLLVLYSSKSLLSESVSVLMEAAPAHLDVDAIRHAMMSVPGVQAVHDLHVWTLTTSLVSLSAHVTVVRDGEGTVLREIERVLGEQFGILHTTIQLESADSATTPGVVREW
jgi:cobalt-zinc-cadmium efflux system protein